MGWLSGVLFTVTHALVLMPILGQGGRQFYSLDLAKFSFKYIFSQPYDNYHET